MRLVGYVHGWPYIGCVEFGVFDWNVATHSETCAGGSGAGVVFVDTSPDTSDAVHTVATTVSGRVVWCLVAHEEERRVFVSLLFYWKEAGRGIPRVGSGTSATERTRKMCVWAIGDIRRHDPAGSGTV